MVRTGTNTETHVVIKGFAYPVNCSGKEQIPRDDGSTCDEETKMALEGVFYITVGAGNDVTAVAKSRLVDSGASKHGRSETSVRVDGRPSRAQLSVIFFDRCPGNK